MNEEEQVLNDTQVALRLKNKLTVSDFILANKNTFDRIKRMGDCFCALNNSFIYVNNEGIKFSNEELMEFYTYCLGRHTNCFNLIDAVSSLGETKAVQSAFKDTMKSKLLNNNIK